MNGPRSGGSDDQNLIMSILVSVTLVPKVGPLANCQTAELLGIGIDGRHAVHRHDDIHAAERGAAAGIEHGAVGGGADDDDGLDALVLELLFEIGIEELVGERGDRLLVAGRRDVLDDVGGGGGAEEGVDDGALLWRAPPPTVSSSRESSPRQRGRWPQFWFMKSSISKAVVLGSSVTGLSCGGGGAFTFAHSSMIVWAPTGEPISPTPAAPASTITGTKALFICILP